MMPWCNSLAFVCQREVVRKKRGERKKKKKRIDRYFMMKRVVYGGNIEFGIHMGKIIPSGIEVKREPYALQHHS